MATTLPAATAADATVARQLEEVLIKIAKGKLQASVDEKSVKLRVMWKKKKRRLGGEKQQVSVRLLPRVGVF